MATFSVPCETTAHCQLYSSLYYTVLYYTILYYTILYYTILYYTILYYTILYYTILYYTPLYCTVLYYTILLYAILCFAVLYSYYILWYTDTILYSCFLAAVETANVWHWSFLRGATYYSIQQPEFYNTQLWLIKNTVISFFFIATVFSWVWITLLWIFWGKGTVDVLTSDTKLFHFCVFYPIYSWTEFVIKFWP